MNQYMIEMEEETFNEMLQVMIDLTYRKGTHLRIDAYDKERILDALTALEVGANTSLNIPIDRE